MSRTVHFSHGHIVTASAHFPKKLLKASYRALLVSFQSCSTWLSMDADHDSAWITIKADSYECMLSVDKLRAFPNSHLANLADIELQRNPVNPSIRLDCEPEVAKELVAIIRHGNNYAAPANNPRLCQVLQHQVDFFLGIPVPDVHAASSSRLQEYLLMPTSAFGEQLMMYSSRAHGWAVVRCNNDWPEQCGFEGARWLSAALPAERNGLGKSLI